MDGHRAFKDDLYEAFARVGGALASPKRLEMLDLLAQQDRSVQSLADEMSVSVANASQHLQTLLDAKLVTTRKEGTYRYYRLADENVFGLWRALRDLARDRLPEVDAIVERHLGDREEVLAQDPSELIARAEADEIVLLDVRPAGEYDWAHLPHAVSMPIDELEARVEDLPGDKPVLVYCRGPFCTYSDEAVATLRRHGLEAKRLEPGAPDLQRMTTNRDQATQEASP